MQKRGSFVNYYMVSLQKHVKHGMWVCVAGVNIMMFPPFIMTPEEVDEVKVYVKLIWQFLISRLMTLTIWKFGLPFLNIIAEMLAYKFQFFFFLFCSFVISMFFRVVKFLNLLLLNTRLKRFGFSTMLYKIYCNSYDGDYNFLFHVFSW